MSRLPCRARKRGPGRTGAVPRPPRHRQLAFAPTAANSEDNVPHGQESGVTVPDVHAFDPYEYVGVIAPGAVVAVALFAVWPEAKTALLIKGFSLGEFGLFLIYAFVLGQLVQAFGNLIEWIAFR